MSIKKYWNDHWAFWAITITIFVLLGMLLSLTYRWDYKLHNIEVYKLIGGFMISVILPLKINYQTLQPEEIALRMWFLLPLDDIGPGPHYVPRFFGFSIRPFDAQYVQFQKPGESVDIWYGKGEPQDGKVAPYRFLSGLPDKNEPEGINTRVVFDETYFVIFRIRSPLNFVRTIGATEQLEKQVDDIIPALVQAEFVKRSPSGIMGSLPEINARLLAEVQLTSDGYSQADRIKIAGGDSKALFTPGRDWGVEFSTVAITPPQFSHTVNIALAGVAESKLLSEGRMAAGKGDASYALQITKAEAEGKKLMAEAIRKEIELKARGFKKMAKDLGWNAQETARYAQLLLFDDKLDDATFNFIAKDMPDVLSIFSAAKALTTNTAGTDNT